LAIEEIDKVVWDPAWGKERITNMIATRPDWCISRQRIWGVPIAVFMCEKCNQPIMSAALNRKIVDLFESEGAEAWHTTDVANLLPAGSCLRRIAAARNSARKLTSSTSGSTPAQAGLPSASPIRS
jgi:isoleucyl-tRNA synthetase